MMTNKGRPIADVKIEAIDEYGTANQTYSDFPIGTKVQVITPFRDFSFFNNETGVVIENRHQYLGIIVEFDKKYKRNDFNFNPSDLFIISVGKDEPVTEQPEEAHDGDELDEILSFGYEDPTFINDIHVLIGGKDKIDRAKKQILAWHENEMAKMST